MIEDHDEELGERSVTPAGTGSARWPVALIGALCVVALVVILLEVLVLRPRHEDMATRREDRSAVLNTAERFMVLSNTYDYSDTESYLNALLPLLSTRARTAYENDQEGSLEIIKQAELVSTGQVLTAGVAALDVDSARVLVVADASVKSKFDTRARHFRWQVDLVRVGGEWLVDKFDPVVSGAVASGTGAEN